MLIVIAKVRRNNQTGGYELVDEGEVLGTFIPGSEFLFEDFVNKEIRMEIRNTEEKETGWKLLNKDVSEDEEDCPCFDIPATGKCKDCQSKKFCDSETAFDSDMCRFTRYHCKEPSP